MLDRIGPGYFRYFLCLVVVFFHSTNFIALGEWAVHVFFILSGYWVVKMYREKYIHFTNPILSFYASRLLRLLPVFYVNIILFIGVVCIVRQISPAVFLEPYLQRTYFVFSHIFILGLTLTGTLIPPSWSLDIEMQFYLLTPLVVWMILQIHKKALTVLILLFLLFSGVYLVHESWYLFPSIANYLCFFLLGVILYHSNYHASKQTAFWITAFGIILVGLTYCIPVIFEQAVLKNTLRVNGILFRVVFDYILAILMIPFISRNVRVNGGLWDKELANLSYITYLFHRVTMFPWATYYGHLSFRERIPSFVLYLVITFAGSVLIYYLVDIPFEKLRKKWVA